MYDYEYSYGGKTYSGSGALDPSDAAGIGAIFGAIAGVWIVIMFIIAIIQIIAMWKVFTKAGEAGWKSLIPIYNLVVLFEISGLSPWLVLVYLISFIPVVGVIGCWVLTIVQEVKLTQNFGKGSGFAVGMVLLPSIFYLILGFDSSTFIGQKYVSNKNNNVNYYNPNQQYNPNMGYNPNQQYNPNMGYNQNQPNNQNVNNNVVAGNPQPQQPVQEQNSEVANTQNTENPTDLNAQDNQNNPNA